MASPLDFCGQGFDPNQFLSAIEGVRGRINQQIGQLNSQINALSSLTRFSASWSGSLDLMDELLGDVFDKCPGLKEFYNCMLPMLNELNFGANAGVTTGITGPCFNGQLQALVEVNLPCLVKSAVRYQEQTGDDPIQVITEDNTTVREMFAPTNLRYTRVGSYIKLEWDDNLNSPGPIIYEISILGTPITVVLDQLEAEIRGLPHGIPVEISVVAKDPTARFVSPPATLEVIAFEQFGLNVTGLTVVAASDEEVLLRWDPVDHPEVVGYNVRWETTERGETKQNVFYVGNRTEILLRGLLSLPTSITVTTVTNWFETSGTSIVVNETNFVLVSAIFDSGVPYPPGATGTLTLTFSSEVSEPGVWNTATLENGNPGEDIDILPADFDKTAPNVMVITFTMPNPPAVPVHSQLSWSIHNLLGDTTLTGTELLP